MDLVEVTVWLCSDKRQPLGGRPSSLRSVAVQEPFAKLGGAVAPEQQPRSERPGGAHGLIHVTGDIEPFEDAIGGYRGGCIRLFAQARFYAILLFKRCMPAVVGTRADIVE